MELNAEFKRLFAFGEQFGDDEARVGYSLEMRRWTREFEAQDYVLAVEDLSRARSVRRLISAGDDAEAIGKATMINERVRLVEENFEPQTDAWWREIVYIVNEAIDDAL